MKPRIFASSGARALALFAFRFSLFALLACPLLAQEVVLSSPLHYRGFDPAMPLLTVQGSGNQTGNITEFRDRATSAPVTWIDFNGRLNTVGAIFSAQWLNKVCMVDVNTPGADAGAKIVYCRDRLPATGGTVDARGLEGVQTIPTDVFTTVTKNVRIIWGAGTYSFGANTTFPANIEQVFGIGSVFAVPNGITVTIGGPLSAPVRQIFSLAGTGKVVFGHGAVKEVYPQWWGAKADGVTDDSAAVQAAINSGFFTGTINSGGVIYFPPGIYLLNSQINVTDFTLGISLVGPRWTTLTGAVAEQGGAHLRGNHTGVMFDFTGSRFVTLENLFIDNGASIPSVGVLFARSTTSVSANYNTLRNVTIYFASRPAANGGNGNVAFYNRAAEIFSVKHVWFRADNPVVITSSATFGVASPFKTIGGSSSTSFMTFDGNCVFSVATNGIGNALFLSVVRNVHFNNIHPIREAGATNDFAVKIYQSDGVFISGQVEVFPRLLDLSGLNTRIKLEASIVSNIGSTIYFSANGATLRHGLVNVIPIGASVVEDLFGMVGATAAVTENIIHLYGNQALGTLSDVGQNYLISGATFGVTLDSKTTHVKRLSASAATALVAGDFALVTTGGWGDTPAASISAVVGTDQATAFTVSAGTANFGANPTVILTFKDLTWTSNPICTANRGDATAPTTGFATTTTTATTMVLTFRGLPAAGTYAFNVVCMGR